MKLKDPMLVQFWKNISRCLTLCCIEDEVDARLSEDDAPIKPEDATHASPNHRPPSYNPEDYAHAISKYARASNIYAQDQRDKKGRGKDKDKHNSKDVHQEMSLKQFASLPELLRRLREDLKTAYISFVKELVRDPHDGVSILLDLLKMIQLAQNNLSGNPPSREQQIALRRALIDEFECLSCLRCCLRCSDSQSRLANYRNGLYCLAAATMSSLTRSRTLALQLLTKACDGCSIGHRQALEAFSTLRLRFSEPVRYKFLVSMMLSHPHPSFQIWCLRFINALICSSTSLRERIYLQEELGEAGFDCSGIKKALEHRGAATQQQHDAVVIELEKWTGGYIDISTLEEQLVAFRSSNSTLHHELQNIRQANMKLLEENVLLRAVGGEVEDRCSALKRRLEHNGLPSAPSPAPSMTDSDISSWATTGQNTIKRSEPQSVSRASSPSRRNDTMSTVDGATTTSPDWTMVRPPSRSVYATTFQDSMPPVPKKRQSLKTGDETNSKRTPEEAAQILQQAQGNITQLNNILHKESIQSNKKETKHKRNSLRSDVNHLEDQVPQPDPKQSRSSSSQSSSFVSLTSSTSSMSSSISVDGETRKDPQYENVPKSDSERTRSRGSSEGDVEYERNVVVYEAIALGNDTILLDKNNTRGSNTSKSDSSTGSFSDIPSVRQSVRHYENMANQKKKLDPQTDETILRQLRKKKKSRRAPSSPGTPKNKSSGASSEVSEVEVEAVMNGLESVIRSAESSISLASMGTVKENPLCYQSADESDSFEIPPPIPPRSSSSGLSSSSVSRGLEDFTRDSSSSRDSPDVDSLRNMKPLPPSPLHTDSDSSHSFGRFQEMRSRTSSTLGDRTNKLIEADHMKKQALKRSESLQIGSDYNSHKTYSPKNAMMPLDETEVNINGRTYTRYTGVETKHKVSSETKRRRNRSIDDRLDSRKKSKELRRSSRARSPAHKTANPYNGFRNPTSAYRESDFGSNFVMTQPDRIQDALVDLVQFEKSGRPRSKSSIDIRRKIVEDPDIPTPDYSATPAGTLTHPLSGRHILDMPSGLY